MTAWGLLAAGVLAPAVRRRLAMPKPLVLGIAGLAPPAAYVLLPPRRSRAVAVCVLNMWAYVAAYEMPHDDPEELAARVRVRYPVAIDRVLGLGAIPTLRLQRTFSTPGQVNGFERVLVMCHWLWFAVPHAAVAYVLWRDPERLPRSAARMYAVFDLGAFFYWTIPTAPPWWAAERGSVRGQEGTRDVRSPADRGGLLEQRPLDVRSPADRGNLDVRSPADRGNLRAHEHLHDLRRMMIEYGPEFWGPLWEPLFKLLGGNPLAAMPSLHFATSLMGAHLLSEVDPVAGFVGWSYTVTLGVALVYLGEHYAIDLIGGAALTETVRVAAPAVAPAAGRLVALLDAVAERASTRS